MNSEIIPRKVRYKIYVDAFQELLNDTIPYSICYCIKRAIRHNTDIDWDWIDTSMVKIGMNFPELHEHMPDRDADDFYLDKDNAWGIYWWKRNDRETRKIVLKKCIQSTK